MVIDIKKLERERKINECKTEIKRKVSNACQWINNNKETLSVVVPVVCLVMKNGTTLIKLKQERDLKEKTIYDRSLGKYLKLKRPLKNADMKAILARRDNGEKLSNILMDMNLLK